ncbi:MAG: hypothetical protein Q7S32_01005 [bacterium]|nr:hypothetical protein [bacterium]
MTNQLVAIVACVFEGCKVRMAEERAFVPAVDDIRKAIGRAVTPIDLADHIYCGYHSRLARGTGMRMYGFVGTRRLLEERVADHQKSGSVFAKYSQTKVGMAMAAVKIVNKAETHSKKRRKEADATSCGG